MGVPHLVSKAELNMSGLGHPNVSGLGHVPVRFEPPVPILCLLSWSLLVHYEEVSLEFTKLMQSALEGNPPVFATKEERAEFEEYYAAVNPRWNRIPEERRRYLEQLIEQQRDKYRRRGNLTNSETGLRVTRLTPHAERTRARHGMLKTLFAGSRSGIGG